MLTRCKNTTLFGLILSNSQLRHSGRAHRQYQATCWHAGAADVICN